MSALDRTERIDAFLAGQMTDEEKQQFEKELLDTAKVSSAGTLKDETELQADIICAIQEQQLRKQLQDEEALARLRGQLAAMQQIVDVSDSDMDLNPLIRATAYRKVGSAFYDIDTSASESMVPTEEMQQKDLHRKRIHRWKIAGISVASMAVAAAVCLCIVLIPTMRTMQQISTQFAQSINIEPMRGAMLDPVETQLEQTYQYIASERWSDAAPIARSLMEQTATPVSGLCQEECQEIHEQAQWLYAMCEMHQGHVFRAKRLLRRIVSANGLYAAQAQQVLDNL